MENKKLLVALFIMTGFQACNHLPSTEKKEDTSLVETIRDSVGYIRILDKEGSAVIDSSSVIEIIAAGYKWSEGPVYVKQGDYLLFSDVPANRVYKWTEGKGTTIFLEPSGYTGSVPKEKEPGSNGLVIDNNGKLVLCQQGNRQIARMKPAINEAGPEFESIASQYEGKKFNSPNDLVYAGNGNLYFTDPPYGLEQGIHDSSKELSYQGVFCVTPDGNVKLVTDKISYPNGIALSPDNQYLYIANSDNEHKEWIKIKLNKEGLEASDSLFYRVTEEEGKLTGNPDGMKINSKGYIFASGPGGIWIFNPAGKVIARIYTGQQTSNCSLDSSHNMLYMTCKSFVMRVRLKS
jgi:gluconolactonase